MRHKNAYLLCLLLLVFSGCMFTPVNRVEFDKVSAHASYYGFDHSAIEIGLGNFTYGWFNSHLDWQVTRSYALAGRIELGDTTMYALEASFWGAGLIGMGINAGYYTNLSSNSFYFRPEVGFGDIPIGFVFIHGAIGWNIQLFNHNAPELNNPNFQIRLTVPLDTSTASS